MFFVGISELAIDGKNRLSIPYAVREAIEATLDGRMYYVRPGRTKGTLELFPDSYFRQRFGRAIGPGGVTDEAHEWRQFEFSQTALLDPDAQGRIVIPERLLKRAGLGKEVSLIGVQDHLELWDREAYEEFEARKWPDYPRYRALMESQPAEPTPGESPAQPT